MSKPPKTPLRDQAKKDHADGQSELLHKLHRLPISELHTVDPALLARLTVEQRRVLFSRDMARQKTATRSRSVIQRRSKPIFSRRLWNLLPHFIRGQIFASLMAAGVTASGLGVLSNIPEINHLIRTLTDFTASNSIGVGSISLTEESHS